MHNYNVDRIVWPSWLKSDTVIGICGVGNVIQIKSYELSDADDDIQ